MYVEISSNNKEKKTTKTASFEQKKPLVIDYKNNKYSMSPYDFFYEVLMVMPELITVISESQVSFG